ncbi:MAG TPA: c-type cytochrome [Steroidobacteraceae bacterium]|nr:c-type cytochrome [Steroidobacteraceae bacterium]
MKVASIGSIVLAAFLASAPGSADEAAATLSAVGGSAEAGASKAAVCGACHGPNGNSSNPEWPNLAGQSANYIATQLHLFKEQVRNNPVMQPIVEPMTEADFKDVAVYFSQQTPQGLEADPSYWQAGEKLYRAGDSTRNIPACIACHGPIGRGNLAAGYPALRAQHSVYTIKQLNAYADGTRYPGASKEKPVSPNASIMATIAKRLTPEEIRDVASYIQGMR